MQEMIATAKAEELHQSGAESVSGVFGAGAELTASAVRVSCSSMLDASTVGSMFVRGSEGVVVSSGGSVVRLSPEGEGEFVVFLWESARSFDSFENVVSPSVSDVEELVIVAVLVRTLVVRVRCHWTCTTGRLG